MLRPLIGFNQRPISNKVFSIKNISGEYFVNLKICGLEFSYQNNQNSVLQNIQLDIETGTFFALIGPNGSGKTTLLKLISGVLKSTSTTSAIYLDCKKLNDFSHRQLSQHLAVVIPEVSPNFDFTVAEIVEMGRLPYLQPWQILQQNDYNTIQQSLEITNLFHLQRRLLRELSSGERQRVWLAMALTQNPKILLLDEPIAHLDIAYQLEILSLLQGLTQKNITVIVTIHDLNLAARYAQSMALLHKGKILVQGKPKDVLQEKWLTYAFQTKLKVWHPPEGGMLVYPC